MSALLEINRALIQEVIQLQALGRAGAPTSQALAQQQQMLQQQGQATGQASPSRAEGDTDAKKDDGKGKDGSTSTDVAKARTAVSSLEYVKYVELFYMTISHDTSGIVRSTSVACQPYETCHEISYSSLGYLLLHAEWGLCSRSITYEPLSGFSYSPLI